MVRLERFCAIRKRTRDDVNREHIRYMVREEIRGILCFADELAVYEDKGEFCFALTYSLCDAEQEADNSERIQALRFCLDASGGPKMEECEI